MIEVGIRSLPYLADHGFHDMVVLPGSFFIEKALALHNNIFGVLPRRARNIRFSHPVILSEENTVITVWAEPSTEESWAYHFGAASASGVPVDGEILSFARLEIEHGYSPTTDLQLPGFSIEAFKAEAAEVLTQEVFYERLRSNGNQYGPHFQNLNSIWRKGGQALGELVFQNRMGAVSSHILHPTLLDSITQLLGSCVLEKAQAFVLKAIERAEFFELDIPDRCYALAQLSSDQSEPAGFSGHLTVFDKTGKTFLELGGVSFAYLESLKPEPQPAAGHVELCIAATFTAEPIEDPLAFWAQHFGTPVEIRFAPYNQIFQQLLASGSLFHKNRSGVNIILIGLEDWLQKVAPADPKVDRERLEAAFRGRKRRVLPNGLEIAHINSYETDYVYKEIFEDQCYFRHGIGLNDGDIVVDIGANIGLFALFAAQRCPKAKIYAFEPSPVTFDLLKANCQAHGPNIHAFNQGVAEKAKTARFTFYENSTVFSSFHPDAGEDHAAIRAVVRNMLRREMPAEEAPLEGYVSELTSDRLSSRSYDCPLVSVSDIIRANQLSQIDLLKIDAEKSEEEILSGIQETDWPKIRQMVIEVHDPTHQAVGRIEALLCEKGFQCTVEQESLLEESGLFNIYALRTEGGRPTAKAKGVGTAEETLQRKIVDFSIALRAFMSRSSCRMIVGVCPPAPEDKFSGSMREVLDKAGAQLLDLAIRIPNVHTLSKEALDRYPAEDYFDPVSLRMGHIPYTPAGYASLGSAVFRKVFAVRTAPYKAIVLDCDNTLWKGVCGEDGPLGVELSPPFRRLQEFMLEQMHRGMLICLGSKNNETDVWEVFERRADMVLRREHLSAWRINWGLKSENILSLARELNLGLDSLIFLDDNPVECADVRANCPAVITLQLPQGGEQIERFLDHVWAFDRLPATAEDRTRTRMVQENLQREKYREQVPSLKDFIDGLQLQVAILEPNPDQIGRVSQLTFRTNQFNFTTIRRSEAELLRCIEKAGTHCLITQVSDRFGDYGLVGVVIFDVGDDCLRVDTFLLSCRVLGRGVEHRILAELGQRAQSAGKRFVEVPFRASEKNQPAWEFITSINPDFQKEAEGRVVFGFSSQKLAGLRYEPQELPPAYARAASEEVRADAPLSLSAGRGIEGFSGKMQQVATELCDVPRIHAAIESFRMRKGGFARAAENVEGLTLEEKLLSIWRRVLGNPHIAPADNFFEAGGTSLKAVLTVAAIRRELGLNLTILNLFESPTVRLMSQRLDGGQSHDKQMDGALARGSRRKQRSRKRA
jgi:FkbH-like protein/FkbM family methyltransferase